METGNCDSNNDVLNAFVTFVNELVRWFVGSLFCLSRAFYYYETRTEVLNKTKLRDDFREDIQKVSDPT